MTALEGKEAQKSWSVFMDYLLKTQEPSIAVAESEASVAEGQRGWTGHSWWSLDTESKCLEGGSGHGLPRRNIDQLPADAEVEIGNPEPVSSWTE